MKKMFLLLTLAFSAAALPAGETVLSGREGRVDLNFDVSARQQVLSASLDLHYKTTPLINEPASVITVRLDGEPIDFVQLKDGEWDASALIPAERFQSGTHTLTLAYQLDFLGGPADSAVTLNDVKNSLQTEFVNKKIAPGIASFKENVLYAGAGKARLNIVVPDLRPQTIKYAADIAAFAANNSPLSDREVTLSLDSSYSADNIIIAYYEGRPEISTSLNEANYLTAFIRARAEHFENITEILKYLPATPAVSFYIDNIQLGTPEIFNPDKHAARNFTFESLGVSEDLPFVWQGQAGEFNFNVPSDAFLSPVQNFTMRFNYNYGPGFAKGSAVQVSLNGAEIRNLPLTNPGGADVRNLAVNFKAANLRGGKNTVTLTPIFEGVSAEPPAVQPLRATVLKTSEINLPAFASYTMQPSLDTVLTDAFPLSARGVVAGVATEHTLSAFNAFINAVYSLNKISPRIIKVASVNAPEAARDTLTVGLGGGAKRVSFARNALNSEVFSLSFTAPDKDALLNLTRNPRDAQKFTTAQTPFGKVNYFALYGAVIWANLWARIAIIIFAVILLSLIAKKIFAGKKAAAALSLLLALSALHAAAAPADWETFKKDYVTFDGRVIDFKKNAASHSEGQGYAMLLSVMNDDKETFDKLWLWTRENIEKRADNLFAWLWGEAADGEWKIIDYNNAADGDILISWALLQASEKFNEPEYKTASRIINEDIRKYLIDASTGYTLLLPGAFGFRTDAGVRVNPSYFIFGAFEDFSASEGTLWGNFLSENALRFIKENRFSSYQIPADWLFYDSALKAWGPQPAAAAEFSYDAVRIPLYLAMSGKTEELQIFLPLMQRMREQNHVPQIVELSRDVFSPLSANAGANMVWALAATKLGEEELTQFFLSNAQNLLETEEKDYYSYILYLLAQEYLK